MSIDAYRFTQYAAEAPRAEEYRRLAELTVMLDRAEREGVRAKLEAIYQNQHFWSGLRAAALSKASKLPAHMKTDFVALAQWVERESAMASLGEANLEGLIAVNKQIMEGLRPVEAPVPEPANAAL